MEGKYMLIRELGKFLGGISRSTIYRAVEQGFIPPPINITPGRIAWERAEVVEWIEERAKRKES